MSDTPKQKITPTHLTRLNKSGAFFGNPFGTTYDAAYNTPQTMLYGNMQPLSEAQMLPYGDRAAIIAHLREAHRNDSRLASMLLHYWLGINCPTPHVSDYDSDVNDVVERYLEDKLDNIRWGAPKYASGLRALLRVLVIERLIAGEVFVVFMGNGQVRVIPSELVGSPTYNTYGVEIDGVIYNADGSIKAYRIGKRSPDGGISFTDEDSTIVNAMFVHHLGTPTRAEEVRMSPPLAPAVKVFFDIKELCAAKVAQAKAQAMLAWAVKKNIDPALHAQIMSDSEMDSQDAYDDINARTRYQKFDPASVYYMEVGESAEPLQSQNNASDFDTFLMSNFDFACGCIGIPPEEALVGYRRSNYSSSRAEKLRWKERISDERAMWTSLLDTLQFWICLRGVISGALDLRGKEPVRRIDWIWPSLAEIDQTKAAQADITEYQSGLMPRSDILAKRGLYADEVDNRRAEDSARLYRIFKAQADKLGISVEMLMALDKRDLPIFVSASESPEVDAPPFNKNGN